MLLKISALVLGLALISFSQKKSKIIFFGDSITQMGVAPGGYIPELDTNFKTNGKTADLAGAGIGGNKVYDLYLRMDDDVLAKSPDAVVIWIGVNDVWHKRSLGTGTDADKFEKFYNAIIKKLRDRNIKVYMCTPAVIGEKNDMSNELDGDLNRYSGIIRSIAQKAGVPLIDLRAAFLAHLAKNNPQNKDRGILTTDGVHLNGEGNKLVAREMYKVLGKDF